MNGFGSASGSIGGHHRSAADSHLARIGLLQLPRRMGALLSPAAIRAPAQATIRRTGTYNYEPVTGQRDILGYIRAPQAGSTGTGYGSNPFIDIGAYQYVNLNPPEVTGVTETPTQGATPVNFYSVGGISGVNQTPWTINITFNGPISPSTLNANTVQLVDLGSNPSQPLDEDINLSGKISYVSSTDTLVINLAAAGLTLGTDAYQITLFGSGSPVITNLQGVALDGENTAGDLPTGAQLALPSGNGYPGGNFYDSFIINTTPPSVEAGSLTMAAASDTNIVGDNITTSTLPTFDGTISEPNPDLVPVAGQTVILDIGIEYNGVTYFSTIGAPANLDQFIRPDAGTATSTTGGAFAVTVGIDAANTGLVTNTDASAQPVRHLQCRGERRSCRPCPAPISGYYVARVRVIDQSGNQSNPADPNAQVPFVVDNTPPTVTVTSPTAGQVITSLTNGVLNFTITTSKNIDHDALQRVVDRSRSARARTASSARATTSRSRSTPPRSRSVYLDKGIGGPGAEQITFSTQAGTTLTNNLYELTLLNTGADAVRDIAGNVLADPGHSGLRRRRPVPGPEPVRGRGSRRRLGHGHQGRPLRHDRRGHDGRGRGRRHRRAPRRLPGTGHDEAVRQAVLGCHQQHRQHRLHDQHRRRALDTSSGPLTRRRLRREPTPRSPRTGIISSDRPRRPRSPASRSPARWYQIRQAERSTRTPSPSMSRIPTSPSTRTTSSTPASALR